MANETNKNATRVKVPCRVSFCNLFEPQTMMNGADAKYSCSCLIDKNDKKTLLAVHNAIEAAKENGKARWGGKIPANLKLPLRDGIEREDDEAYKDCMFFNCSNREKPQVVDRKVQQITDPSEVYSGCYCIVSVNFYPFSNSGNRGIAVSLGNVQKVRDGEPLSGRVSAVSEFDELGDDDLVGEELPDYLR